MTAPIRFLDLDGQEIPEAGRSARVFAAAGDQRAPTTGSMRTALILGSVFISTLAAVALAEGTTAMFTTHNAHRIAAQSGDHR